MANYVIFQFILMLHLGITLISPIFFDCFNTFSPNPNPTIMVYICPGEKWCKMPEVTASTNVH